MKFRLLILFGLIPCIVFAEGQYGMEEWIIKMNIQSLFFYTLIIGLFLTLINGVFRKRIFKRQTFISFGIGFGLSILSLIITTLIDIESAYMIPYLLFLDLFQ